jgi:hypothetical protein
MSAARGGSAEEGEGEGAECCVCKGDASVEFACKGEFFIAATAAGIVGGTCCMVLRRSRCADPLLTPTEGSLLTSVELADSGADEEGEGCACCP